MRLCYRQLLLWLFLLAVIRNSGKSKQKVKPEEKKSECPEASVKSERTLVFTAKKADGSIWPHETSYAKCKMEPTNVDCGAFNMRIVDLPLRRLQMSTESEWELAGDVEPDDSNTAADPATPAVPQRHPDSTPVHLLKVKPSWYPRLQGKLRIYIETRRRCRRKYEDWRKSIFGTHGDYERCLLIQRERQRIGPNSMFPDYWPFSWKDSIFSRRAKSYKLKFNKKYIQNAHPGVDGAGAINRASRLYLAYPGIEYIKKYIASNMDVTERVKNDYRLSYFIMLRYSEFDYEQCTQMDCPSDLFKDGSFPFSFSFFRIIPMEPAERLGFLRMKWPLWVHELSGDDHKVPNLFKRDKSVKLKLKLKPLCGAGGPCIRAGRSMFGTDGWDLFHGEQIQFKLSVLSSPQHFKIRIFQNPLITLLFGEGTVVFGKRQRRKTIRIKGTNKLEWNAKYQFKYHMSYQGHWHRWYLYYGKLFESMKAEALANQQKRAPQTGSSSTCQKSSMYAPVRPIAGCDWGTLKSRYVQDWFIEPPKPGVFEHDLTDQMFFSFMQVGQTRCGHITAEIEEFPPNPRKNYVKLLLIYLGTQGGLSFPKVRYTTLRFPSMIVLNPFRKYRKEWCVKGVVHGSYAMTFDVYGALAGTLFPTPPTQISIQVNPREPFRVQICAALYGATLYNNEWSDRFYITLSRLPNAKKQESEIVITPKMEGDSVQFSPNQFQWTPDSTETRIYFKMRTLLDCAANGVEIRIQWETLGMVGQIWPYPLPDTVVRVVENVVSAGCATADDADNEQDDAFEALPEEQAPLDLPEKNISVPNATLSRGPKQKKIVEQVKKSKITFVVAILSLAVFAVVILALCAFGFLGKDDEFEMAVAQQLRNAILSKQKELFTEKMNRFGPSNLLESHFETNRENRARLLDQSHTLD